ncbi:MAG: ribonuclease Z [Methanobacterium sp. BRmetb2]|jgi:ribonuclease Z|nr:MAG: ribonuclease Z [Methanobacterium sp. BRmetb2]
MELIFLGTSSALPTKFRNHSSIALKAYGEIFLFDCGEGTQRQMSKMKLSPMKINKIFITHFHGDHFLGIPGIIQTMGFRGRKSPLHIFGPSGIVEIVEHIVKLGYFSLTFDIHVHEIKNGTIFEEEDYKIKCAQMNHTVPNFAYSIIEKRRPKFLRDKALSYGIKPGPDYGKLQKGVAVKVGDRFIKPEQVLGPARKGIKIVYSGDTRPCREMVEFADKADVLIHESTFESKHNDKAQENGHSTVIQAAEIAKKAKVNKLILTHISTRYKKVDLLEKEATNIFKNSMIAEDFMIYEVKRHGN